MKRSAFSLVELLTVIAIVSLLLAILVPSLSRARAHSKLRVCSSNLHQIGLGVTSYATMNKGIIPLGPSNTNPFGVAWLDMGSNQIWIGKPAGATAPVGYCGLGILLKNRIVTPPVLYCPADMSDDVDEEQPRIETDSDAYCSYLYRQRQMVVGKPTLGDLGSYPVKRGRNGSDTTVKVQALALDMQSTGQGPMQHLTHEGQNVNILWQDVSVRDFGNPLEQTTDPMTGAGGPVKTGIFTFPQELIALARDRIGEIILRADFAYQSNPIDTPISRDVMLVK